MKYLFAVVLTCILALSGASPVAGQDFAMRHYTIENGLPSNRIFAIYKDHTGYLWIGTDKGTVRYNGMELEKFTTNDGLPSNEIFHFEEDCYGRLWMATYSGELCYYQDGVFHNSSNTPFLKLGFSHLFAETIETAKDSTITVWFKDHIHYLNIRKNTISFCQSRDVADLRISEECCMIKEAPNRYLTVCQYNSYVVDTLGNIVKKIKNQNRDRYIYRCVYDQKYLISPTGVFDLNEKLLFKFRDTLSKLSIYTAMKFDEDWFIGG